MSFVQAGVITRRNSRGVNLDFDVKIALAADAGQLVQRSSHDHGQWLYGSVVRLRNGSETPRLDVEFADDFTHIHGRHTIHAGADETGYKMWNRVPSAANVTGFFGFTGSWTGNSGFPNLAHSNGNSFADFLLGTANSSQTSATGAYASWLYTRYWGFYAQDTWQASPRLTIIYGLRYEYQTPWRYRTQQITSFDFKNNKLVLPQNSATPTLPPGALPELLRGLPLRNHSVDRGASVLLSGGQEQLCAESRFGVPAIQRPANSDSRRIWRLLQFPAWFGGFRTRGI